MKAKERPSDIVRARTVRTLTVRAAAALPGDAGPRGHVRVGCLSLACALGRGGLSRRKREGDGATPTGGFAVLHGFFRPDRVRRPFCRISLRALPPDLGWCDDPASPLYNRGCKLPLRAGHEVMWRRDGLYDVVFVLDYNLAPRRIGAGSAIFLHCAKPGCDKSAPRPTLGCVALAPEDMRRLLPRLARRPRILVG